MQKNLQDLLEKKHSLYNNPTFIQDDPIRIPHLFSRLQDIEITGFWTAMLAWGQRKTILNNAAELVRRMDNAPYDFIINHEEKDREKFLSFKHRTFQATDTLYFLEFFQHYYGHHHTLEDAFCRHLAPQDITVENALKGFHDVFFSLQGYPARTRKHVATPRTGATCKRLNMFLRWMVRRDKNGVDFGLWKRINPSQLLIPLDVHVDRVARQLGLLERRQTDWQAVLELTANLRKIDASDPVRYDFALFGMGVLEPRLSYEAFKAS